MWWVCITNLNLLQNLYLGNLSASREFLLNWLDLTYENLPNYIKCDHKLSMQMRKT